MKWVRILKSFLGSKNWERRKAPKNYFYAEYYVSSTKQSISYTLYIYMYFLHSLWSQTHGGPS